MNEQVNRNNDQNHVSIAHEQAEIQTAKTHFQVQKDAKKPFFSIGSAGSM